MDNFQSILKLLLVIADATQVRHWFKSRSYNEHTLLGSLYYEIRNGADQIAEYLSESGSENYIVNHRTVELSDFLNNLNNKNTLELIDAARNAYYVMRNAKTTDNTFCSLIDELDKKLVEVSYQIKQELRNIKALRAKKLNAKKKKSIKSAASFQDVYKIIGNTLKQIKVDKDSSVLPIKQDNLFVITYEGNMTNKVSDKIITTLENNLDADWVVYLEDIETEFAIIHCERNH